MVRDRKLMIQALKTFEVEKQSPKELTKMMIDIIDTLAQADDIISKKVAPPAKKTEWISVNDRLPEAWDKYFCIMIKPYNGGFIRTKELLEFSTDKHWVCKGIATHWLETPEFPPAPIL